MKATDRLVRLYSVTDPIEAERIDSLLKQNNIECAIDGGQPLGASGVLRIGLTVWEKDFDRAKVLLEEYQRRQCPTRPLP